MPQKPSLSFTPDEELTDSLRGATLLIKVGGNALTDMDIKQEIISQIAYLAGLGARPVIVHGGGIMIKQLLDDVGIVSEFVGGHRKTDAQSMAYVEMALSGHVNKELVHLLNRTGRRAVGISGKDAAMVTARKRFHIEKNNGTETRTDLGHVGDVYSVDTALIESLTASDFIPVVSPVSSGDDGNDYNINADMFAGHLAGALKADCLIALTNIDGLLKDIHDPGTIIHEMKASEAGNLFGSVIQGGMIPKIESCLIALKKGVKRARIINGTQKENLLRMLLTKEKTGTAITS